eukprot:g1574.t1
MSAGGGGRAGIYRRKTNNNNSHTDAIWALAWGGPTDVLLTAACDETVRLWDPKNLANPTRILQHHNLAAVSAESLLHHNLAAVSADVSGDGKLAVTASMDGTLRFYNLVEGTQQGKPLAIGPSSVWSVAFHPSGAFVASGSHKGVVSLYATKPSAENKKGTLKSVSTGGQFILRVAFSPDGKQLAASDQGGAVYLFAVSSSPKADLALTRKLKAHAKPVRALAFSPDSRLLLSGGDDCAILAHDTTHGELVKQYTAHRSLVTDVAWNPNPQPPRFASCSSDKTVKIWDAAQGECLHSFETTHKDQVWGVRFNAKGNVLASVGEDKVLQLYDILE